MQVSKKKIKNKKYKLKSNETIIPICSWIYQWCDAFCIIRRYYCLNRDEIERRRECISTRNSPFNDVIRAYRKYFWKSFWRLIDAEFSPSFTGTNCAFILLIEAEKSNFEILMTSFAHTGSTFEKVVEAWLMQNLVLYSLAQTAH